MKDEMREEMKRLKEERKVRVEAMRMMAEMTGDVSLKALAVLAKCKEKLSILEEYVATTKTTDEREEEYSKIIDISQQLANILDDFIKENDILEGEE